MDGHDHNVVTLHTQSGERNEKVVTTCNIFIAAPNTNTCKEAPLKFDSQIHAMLYRLAILNSLFELLYHRDGSVGIQPSGGFIKEQYLWLNDQFHSDAGPLPLSTRYSTDKLIPDLHTPIFD